METDQALASASTLCRLENRASRAWMWTIHRVLVDPFIASFKAPPKQLVLDVDATDEAVHGQQQGRFFHGYYDHDCFLPLYEFGGDPLLAERIYGRARSTQRSMRGRSWRYWPGVCARPGNALARSNACLASSITLPPPGIANGALS